MNSEDRSNSGQIGQYPIAEKIPPEVLEAEVKRLEELKAKPYISEGISAWADPASWIRP